MTLSEEQVSQGLEQARQARQARLYRPARDPVLRDS